MSQSISEIGLKGVKESLSQLFKNAEKISNINSTDDKTEAVILFKESELQVKASLKLIALDKGGILDIIS